MIKVLVIVTSHFGFDGISNVATNYYTLIPQHYNLTLFISS